MRAVPVAARIGHARIEHCGVEVVAYVIVNFPGARCLLQALPAEQAAAQGTERGAQRPDLAIEVGAQDLVEELVELLDFPVTVHVALAQAQAAQLNDRISAALDSSLDLPARVEAAVEAWLDFAGARPTLMRLFMREVAGSEGGLRPEVQQFVDPMFARLVGTLDEGCRTNTFRAIDPVQFWSILAGASMFFIMDAPLLANAETVARLDTYKQELKRVARHMLGTGETA